MFKWWTVGKVKNSMVLNAMYRNRAIWNLVLSVSDGGVAWLLFGTLYIVLNFLFCFSPATLVYQKRYPSCGVNRGKVLPWTVNTRVYVCVAELIHAASDVATHRILLSFPSTDHRAGPGKQVNPCRRVGCFVLILTVWPRPFAGGHCCRFWSLCVLAVSVPRPESTDWSQGIPI